MIQMSRNNFWALVKKVSNYNLTDNLRLNSYYKISSTYLQ